MQLFYEYFFQAAWVVFLAYWWIRSFSTKAAQRIEPVGSRIFRSVLCLSAIAVLLTNRIPLPWLYRHLWSTGIWTFWVGVVVCFAGLLFAVWAREHLASNWSSSITIKHGHELVTSGPYRVVRHPIYTGILTGFLGTAIAIGQVRGFLAAALFLVAFWTKMRMEEQFMRTQFGDTYVAYCRRTSALVPYLL